MALEDSGLPDYGSAIGPWLVLGSHRVVHLVEGGVGDGQGRAGADDDGRQGAGEERRTADDALGQPEAADDGVEEYV